MSHALINISDLTVRYRPRSGEEVTALDDVSLEVSPGEVVGILGESGSGKSTLASAILQLLPTNAHCKGSILFQDNNLAQLGERELRSIRGRHVSMISQDPASSLNPVMRVGTQISEVLRAHLELNGAERNRRVLELLREVGFDDPDRICASYPHQLSGGQRQRVVIAQAIACRPELIIADEPVSKLDVVLQTEILNLIGSLVRDHNIALLWITHEPATLAGFADRILIMLRGQIVEEGRPRDILASPGHTYTQHLIDLSKELTLTSSRPARHAY